MQSLISLAEPVAALLKQRGETVAVSESSSGGLIAAALLAVPGASAYFAGGGVVYTHKAREVLLEIDFADYPGMRSSSEPYAQLAAATIRTRLGSTWGLSETGAAGPTGNRYGDAAGHSCIAVAGPVNHSMVLESGDSDREANMWLFTKTALQVFEQVLRGAA
jgi:PncC family amidohydrolase